MTTTKTKQTKKQKLINASIRRLNTAYKKASPAGRRVLIAKDALKQITSRKYNPCRGVWADFSRVTEEIQTNIEKTQLQPFLHDPKAPTCNVCGIGSLFLSAVRMRNDYKVYGGQYGSDREALFGLKEFSKEQRTLIEMAFERGAGYHSQGTYNTNAQLAAARWAYTFLSNGEKDVSVKRLPLILKNIIRNGGRFNPYEL